VRRLCILLILIWSAGAAAGGRWTFPDPFGMDSPESPHRNGGIEFRMLAADSGWALAMPLRSNMTSESRVFIASAFLPLLVTIPDQGDAEFGFGDPRIGVRGSWRLDFPLAEGESIPMAISGGADVNIPLSSLWGDPLPVAGELAGVTAYARAAGVSMYTENPLGWIGGFWGINPRVSVALGEPLFFFEADTTMIIMFPIAWSDQYDTEIWFNWAAAFGSQPHETVAVIAEFNGTVDLTGSGSFRGFLEPNLVFAAVGVRCYYQGLIGGLMARLPLMDVWRTADDAKVIFSLFLGGELRSP
jgi:hypothetical protein